MARKELIKLIEENGMILERIFARIHQYPSQTVGYSRQQLMILVDLLVSGKSKLKEIAHREGMPTPNLCIMFRKLEGEGLVARTIDEQDRRNTWYSLTAKGQKTANQFKDAVLNTIESFFHGLSSAEEKKLTECMNYFNGVLKRVEEQNA
ncbi:MAG: MarR family transcriptional regulator [Alphaproteobacteria bacterium]|nr:MarR family transcriptional regulator [Alphaproteobacteria bacterium]